MQLNCVDFLLWAAGLFGHILLLFVLWNRHRMSTFPFFTTLITSNVVRSITLFLIASRGIEHGYLIAYSVLAVFDLVLQLCVIYELASHVFRPTGQWAPDVRRGFGIGVGISIAIAAAMTCLPTNPEKTRLMAMLNGGNFFSSALMCEFFVGMIVLSVTVRLPWKTHVARIAQGLGFYSLLSVLAAAGHSVVGTERSSTWSDDITLVRMIAYLICLGYWIITLWRKAPEPKELSEEMRRQLFILQRRTEYDLRRLRMLKR